MFGSVVCTFNMCCDFRYQALLLSASNIEKMGMDLGTRLAHYHCQQQIFLAAQFYPNYYHAPNANVLLEILIYVFHYKSSFFWL